MSRADLKPEVQAEYDRLLSERRAGDPAGPHIDGTPGSGPGKAGRTFARIMTLLAVLAFVAFVAVMLGNTRYSYRMLRDDLNRVRLPSGYRLVTVSRSGNCSGCWLTETWTWSGNGRRTAPGACSDVYHAMATAYPPQRYGSLDGNSRQYMPAGTVCDYDTVKTGPGFAKVGIEAFARPGEARNGGVVIQLIASSDCYDPVSRKPGC